MKRPMIKTIISLITISALMAGTVGCGSDTSVSDEPIVVIENENETITYKLATVLRGDVLKTQRLKCTYKQTNAEEISVSVSGKLIDKVFVKEGDTVKKGDILCELTAESLEEDIERLQYNISRNELLLSYLDNNEDYDISERWLYMGGAGVSSIQKNYRYKREDYSDALEFDRKELSRLKAELKNSKIYAGMNGIVYNLEENLEGSTSKKDKVIMSIVDSGECLFITESPELSVYFKDGESVSMSIASGVASGEYELVPYNMNEWDDIQQFAVLNGPDGYTLDVGINGTMRVVVGKKENVLYLPSTTIHSADNEYYVYILDENNMRQVRFVEIGLEGDDFTEVISGLEEGDKVVKR